MSSDTYSPAFLAAVTLTLSHEGGYVNDPHDPGGETNYGISKRAYPHEDIRHLTPERAQSLYHRDYWIAVRGDDLPPALAMQVFDMAVNAGVGTAIRLLQSTLRVTIDGNLGPLTLAAAAKSGRSAATGYARRRIRYYVDLAGWSLYGDSWTQRTLATLVDAISI